MTSGNVLTRPREALRADSHGRPVPYTTLWTGEGDATDVRPCVHAGGALAVHHPGPAFSGAPVFGRTNAARQRECIARGLCGVCSAPLTERWLLGADVPPVALASGTTGTGYLSSAALMCGDCAAVALVMCPWLLRLVHNGAPWGGPLQAVRVEAWDTLRLCTTPGGPVSLLAVHTVVWEEFTAEEFIARRSPAVRRAAPATESGASRARARPRAPRAVPPRP